MHGGRVQHTVFFMESLTISATKIEIRSEFCFSLFDCVQCNTRDWQACAAWGLHRTWHVHAYDKAVARRASGSYEADASARGPRGKMVAVGHDHMRRIMIERGAAIHKLFLHDIPTDADSRPESRIYAVSTAIA